jgi:hypothetical protein
MMRYTVMTTGRGGVRTPYGVIEFTHSMHPEGREEIIFDETRRAYVAAPKRPLADLRRMRRIREHVDTDVLKRSISNATVKL